MNSLARTLLRPLLAVLVLSIAAATSLFAQAPLEPSHLPESTIFYVLWRGAPVQQVREANSLYALWDDPDFAPARAAMIDNFLSQADKKSGASPQITREEFSEYATLLENPFVLGYLSDPAKRNAKTPHHRAPEKARDWNGFFFAYDRIGKEALLAKAVLRMRAAEKEAPAISSVDIAGSPALKIERKSGITYWMESGKYVLSSGETSVLEEILGRLKNNSAPGPSLADSAAFKEAGSLVGSGILEYFVRVPNLQDLSPTTTAGGFRAGSILDALKIDSIHSLCGHIVLDGSRTRMQGALLGDASQGTLFDLWNNGQEVPASLSYAGPDAIAYNETQINLQGIYGIAKRTADALMPRGQQSSTDFVESMARARLGMPIPDALSALTGEFASLQTNASFDLGKRTYLFGIQDKDTSLKLLRHIFSDRISSERSEGNVTFLKISFSGTQGSAGLTQWNYYHFAVTPDMILVSNKLDTLKQHLAQHSASPTSTGLRASFLAHRDKYPPTVTSLGLMDLQKFDWQSIENQLANPGKDKASTSKNLGAQKTAPATTNTWLDAIDPKVFPRHLHFLSSSSWKDATGVHFDGWLD